MITVSLVHPSALGYFFLVMRTFKVYAFSNFLIHMHCSTPFYIRDLSILKSQGSETNAPQILRDNYIQYSCIS